MPVLLRSTASLELPSLKASMASRYILRAMKISPRISEEIGGFGCAVDCGTEPLSSIGCAYPVAVNAAAMRRMEPGRQTIVAPYRSYLSTPVIRGYTPAVG